MNNILEEYEKQKRIKAQQKTVGTSNPPPQTRLTLPINVSNVFKIDEEMIQLLFTYKKRIQEKVEERVSEEFYKKQEGPSQEAKELKSFLYDHLDDFEEVLDEDDYDELESLIMNIE